MVPFKFGKQIFGIIIIKTPVFHLKTTYWSTKQHLRTFYKAINLMHCDRRSFESMTANECTFDISVWTTRSVRGNLWNRKKTLQLHSQFQSKMLVLAIRQKQFMSPKKPPSERAYIKTLIQQKWWFLIICSQIFPKIQTIQCRIKAKIL